MMAMMVMERGKGKKGGEGMGGGLDGFGFSFSGGPVCLSPDFWWPRRAWVSCWSLGHAEERRAVVPLRCGGRTTQQRFLVVALPLS